MATCLYYPKVATAAEVVSNCRIQRKI